MYHIVYLTTNLVNLKIYVGVHSTYNLNDGYIGSGKTIKKAIKKYGHSNFKREVLHYCLDELQMNYWESYIVDESFIKRKDTYNIKFGGGSKSQHSDETKLLISQKGKGRVRTQESKNRQSNSLKGKPKPPRSQEHIDKLAVASSIGNKGKPKSKEHIQKVVNAITGRKASEEQKENMVIARHKAYNTQIQNLIYFILLKYDKKEIDYAVVRISIPRNGFSEKILFLYGILVFLQQQKTPSNSNRWSL